MMGKQDVANGAVFRYPTEYNVDMDAVRRYRIARVREQMAQEDLGAVLLFDPLNIRYATDSSNMQVWVSHDPCRYALICADGPLILFDYPGSYHLSNGLLVDEVRPATSFFYFTAGERSQEKAESFAAEISDIMQTRCGGNNRLALDRTQHLGTLALLKHNIELHDATRTMEHARKIKSAEELKAMQASIDATQKGMRRMHDEMRPGMTEIELWSILHQENIARGGEWLECRLLASGPRTNPWFQEASFRTIENGDMVSYDTDCVGPFGYCCDISRAFICGDAEPTQAQKEVYRIAHNHIEHNISIVKPGMSFREYAEQIRPLPPEYFPNRYSCCAHGIGLVDEYPCIPYIEDFDKSGYDGIFEPGMCLCVESYIGHVDGVEGVKLEEQLVITEDGYRRLSDFPFEQSLL